MVDWIAEEDAEDPDRDRGILSDADRRYLLADRDEWVSERTKQAESRRRNAIQKRVQNALLDFHLLVEYWPAERRDELFAADVGTAEDAELQAVLSDVIRFMYAGLGGPQRFERPLREGVEKGEVTLGNVESGLLVSVDFDVDYSTAHDIRGVIEDIRGGEWSEISSTDILALFRFAQSTNTFDIDSLAAEWEQRNAIANMPPHPGWKAKALGDGKGMSPFMPPEVYREKAIDEMTPEERQELFSEAPYPHRACYDGEKVFIPRPSDEEPEILHYTD